MRIQGIWKIVKNKHELSLIVGILTFSFAILSAVTIVSDTYQMQIFSEIMDESVVDFRVTLDTRQDPSQDFERYLSEYDGWLQIETQYQTEVISISSGLLNLTYLNESTNISDQWDFQTSPSEIFFIGIDELTFNVLNNGTTNPIVNLKGITYAQLEEQCVVANLLHTYDSLISELNCIISTNANNSEDRDLPIQINLFNDAANTSLTFLSNQLTKPNSNFTLRSSFDLYDEKKFYSLLGLDQWQFGAPIFLCGSKLLDQFISLEESEIPHISKSVSLSARLNRILILKHNPQQLRRELDIFQQASEDSTSEFWSLWISWGDWSTNLDDLIQNGNRFQMYSVIIFIPVFLLCGKYMKTSFQYFMEKRRNELGVYMINGMQHQLLTRMFLGVGFLIGAIGGLFGAIGGLFLTRGVGSLLFPSTSTIAHYIQVDTWLILLQNGVVNMIAGGIFAMWAMNKPLQMLNQEELQTNLSKTHHLIQKDDPNSPIRNVILIVFCIALCVAYIYDITFDMFDFALLTDEYPLLYWILFILGPLMGLFPFLFPTFLISWISEKLNRWFESFRRKKFENKSRQKILGAIKQNRQTSQRRIRSSSHMEKLVTWNLAHRMNKNQKIIEIFALAVIFITISVNLNQTYGYSEDIHATLYHANGEILTVHLDDDQSLKDLRSFGQMLQNNASQYEFDTQCAFFHTQSNEARYVDSETSWDIQITSLEPSKLWKYCFSWVNYSLLPQNTTFRDEWIIGGTFEDMMVRMQSPQSIMVPQYLLEEGVEINETITFSYLTMNGTIIQKEGVVVGAYSKFPASFMERTTAPEIDVEIYMSLDLLQDAMIDLLEFVFYTNGEFAEAQKTHLIQFFYDNLVGDFSLRFIDISQYYDNYDSKIFELFQIEGYLFVIFAFFGFLIYSLMDIFQTNVELALLRAKGILEKDLLVSTVYESLVLVGIGSILSLLSIVGTKGLILYLNLERTGSGGNIFYLFYQMNWWRFLLITTIGGFFFFLISLFFNILQIKSTRSDKQLEQLMRTSK
ncbi:hypothetical protein [Candidatus Lokiarchaeum ossiferum]|uniref:hypothetical protein n=1 Tax=Candidatus Lokiarchaeum ossiferum TaxID=2951803 RepID=UPI00352F67C2